MGVTVNIICYKSKTLSNGEYPLMIRVFKDKTRKYKSLGISLNPIYWDFEKNTPKKNCPNRELIEKIIAEKKKSYLEQILMFRAMNRDYTASTLVDKVEKPHQIKTVDEVFLEQIAKHRDENRLGNMKVIQELYKSLKKFNKDLNIYFVDIDELWLEKYTSFLNKKSLSANTIGIRLRTLRAIYNQAIKESNVSKEFYPFRNFKFKNFQRETVKRAITKNDIEKLSVYQTNQQDKRFAIDIFLFSYIMGGINFVDIALLTKENLIENRLIYVRRKTKKLIKLPLHSKAIELIDSYREEDNLYLFPILSFFHRTEQQKANRIHKVISKVNKSLKSIGKELCLSVNLTTYVARHSFATILKKSGISTAIISETLGHSTEKITQVYLDSFDNAQIKEAMSNLL